MQHTEACLENTKRWKAAKDEFVVRHPNYCHSCNGWGGTWYSYDPSPAGVSLSAGSMADFDPCMTCLEQGLCPHCGEELAEDGMYLVCEKCGWTEETEEGIPEEPECICPEEGYEAMFPDFTTRGERL